MYISCNVIKTSITRKKYQEAIHIHRDGFGFFLLFLKSVCCSGKQTEEINKSFSLVLATFLFQRELLLINMY